MSQLDKIDLENEKASLALIEALFDVSIDQCPQRAKRLFRDITNLP